MSEPEVQLDHTIVSARDKRVSASFLAELLGLAAPVPFGPFLAVRLDNNVTLDFIDDDQPIEPVHYAFRVSAARFDAAFARLRAHGQTYWADPRRRRAGEVDTDQGGRRVYFEDPSGHFLEIFTQPPAG